MPYRVDFTRIQRELKKLPGQIRNKLLAWARLVESKGLPEARKVPGYHDEHLKGKRRRQRSIRLSRSYRAIYQEETDGRLSIVSILEVNKHEY